MTEQRAMDTPDPKIVHALKVYLVEHILQGESIELDGQTPLLEWGLIDSLVMVDLITFIAERFEVMLPDKEVRPEHFQSLNSLSLLIVRIRDGGAGDRGQTGEAPGPMTAQGIEARWVELGALGRLHVLRTAGAAPAWILLPALGTPGSTWSSILRSSVEEQEACAIDLPGFGVSTSPKEVLTLRDHVTVITRFLEAQERPPYILIAASLSAMIAAEIARRHPALVRALVVLGFGAIREPRAWWARVGGGSDEPSRILHDYYQPLSLSPAQRQLIKDTLEAAAYRTFLDDEAFEAMPSIFEGVRAPTLFISGEDDMIVPLSAVQNASASIPGARVELLARCGHFPHIERSQETLSFVRSFLEGLPGS